MNTVSGFDWEEGNRGKCQKHGVSPNEIEQVFRSGPLVLPDRTGNAEIRFNAVGLNADNRHVFVVYTLREKGEGTFIRALSARYMHDKEVKAYERGKKS